jgi:hypothetical protein
MKKYFFLLLTILSYGVSAQKKEDTLTLKNGQVITGYIYKMDGGKIFLTRQTDSVMYTADEVQSIMFCHEVRGKGASYSSSSPCPCDDKTISDKAGSSKNRSDSYSGNPCDDNDKEEKGMVIFRCNMCGNNGSLQINSSGKGNKTDSKTTFSLDKGERFSLHTEHLPPGEYTWVYNDTNKNSTKGKFTIRNGEEKKIVLFEKE